MIKASIEELKRIKMVIDGVKDFIRDSKANFLKEFGDNLNKDQKKGVERFAEYAHSEIQQAAQKFEKLILEAEEKEKDLKNEASKS